MANPSSYPSRGPIIPVGRSGAGHTRVGARGFRPDIQGLRAIAVCLVVSNHLIGVPRGGFVGVDVFFVLSGYLITRLMLREKERTGRISWVDFYRRRIRRIVPVAVIVLALTVAVAFYIYRQVRAKFIAVDALWSLCFMANWHYASAGTDYFNDTTSTSPLQHYWSLAVEEQFYLVWPVLLIGIAVLAKGARSYRRLVNALLLAAIVGPFGYSLLHSAANPTTAYFSTLDRSWELAVGCFVAANEGALRRWPSAVRAIASSVGIAGIAASALLISDTSKSPAPWAALPVLSTALLAAAGVSGTVWSGGLLSNPVSQYIGNISYSLYLWHFPVIILATAYFGRMTAIVECSAVAAAFVLSIVSFHYIEDPIRRSHWLDRRRRPQRRRGRTVDLERLRTLGRGVVVAWSVATFVVAGYVWNGGSFGVGGPESARVMAEGKAVAGGPHVPGPRVVPTQTSKEPSLQSAIDNAVWSNSFPKLDPSIDDLPDNKAPQWTVNGCGTVGPWNATKCVYGSASATRTVAVMGDSIALSWLPGIIAAFEPTGYRVYSLVAGQCPTADIKVHTKGSKELSTDCEDHRAWAMTAVEKLKPDLIITSDSQSDVSNLVSGAAGAAAEKEWYGGAVRAWSQLATVAPTLVLGAPPGSASLVDCATVRATPADCAKDAVRDSAWVTLRSAEQRAAAKTGVRLLPTVDWFCTKELVCPSFVGTTPVYVDGVHLTRQYSTMLAPQIAAAVAGVRAGAAGGATAGVAAR